MDREDFRKAGVIVMLLALIYTAPQWLNPQQAHVSAYSAPWIYPGLEPAENP